MTLQCEEALISLHDKRLKSQRSRSWTTAKAAVEAVDSQTQDMRGEEPPRPRPKIVALSERLQPNWLPGPANVTLALEQTTQTAKQTLVCYLWSDCAAHSNELV